MHTPEKKVLFELQIKQANEVIDIAEIYSQDDRYYMKFKRLKTVHMITDDEYHILSRSNARMAPCVMQPKHGNN